MAADWSRLRAHAESQAGLVTRHQCLEAGLTDAVVRHRVSSRRWVRAHEGVFLTTPGRRDWFVTAATAFLAVQSSSVVADAAFRGSTAVYLSGALRHPPASIELAVPEHRRVVAPRGATVRRVRRWDQSLHDTAYPWRQTIEAAVIDMCRDREADEALAVVARVVQHQVTSVSSLRRELDAAGPHRHGRLLREALVDVGDGSHSPAEIRLVRDVLRAHGLPVGSRQVAAKVGRSAVRDMVYDSLRFIVEIDGRLGHEAWQDRVRDGRRDRLALARDEAVTIRLFWSDVAVAPCLTAVDLWAIFAARGWSGRPHPCRRRGCDLRRARAGGSWLPGQPGSSSHRGIRR